MRAWVAWVAVFFAGVGGLWMVNGHFNSQNRSEAYEAASPCAEGRPAPDCRSKETATITGKTEKRTGRSGRVYRLQLRVPDGNATASVTAAQYEALSAGDSLDIERWHRYVTRIYRNGKPEAIVQTPRRRTPMLAMGIASFVVALGLLFVALKIRRKQKLAKISQLA